MARARTKATSQRLTIGGDPHGLGRTRRSDATVQRDR